MKCVIVVLALLSIAFEIEAAPKAHRPPASCLHIEMEDCEMDSGPVCGIDASGISETFENKCMAYVLACQRDTWLFVIAFCLVSFFQFDFCSPEKSCPVVKKNDSQVFVEVKPGDC